jgi:4-hydroxyacetophenone monooxygenase
MMSAKMTRQELAEAVARANVPTLLMVLVELTGDRRWLTEHYRVRGGRGVSDNDTGGLEPAVQEEIREAAIFAIERWRMGTPTALRHPDPDFLVAMLSASMGEDVPAEYGAMLASDMAAGLDIPAPARWHDGAGAKELPDAIIVGGGISGLCAAVALARNGYRYSVIESASSLGGTWRDNRYPAAAVDTPSHLYSFSFAPSDWERYFATRAQIQAYLLQVAERLHVLENIRFKTTVTSARFNAAHQRWDVEVGSDDGATAVLGARYLISGVGAFNPPKLPAIRGLSTFGESMFHTARWPENRDVSGQDVAVIGNGASAMQLVPAIAPTVRSLTIFQRSAHWIAPFEKFQQPVPSPVRRLIQEVPPYARWYRARLGWLFNDKMYPLLKRDPAWPHPDRAMNAHSDRYRQTLTEYIKSELGDRIDLLEAVLPTYPPGGKRLLLDNGWYKTLQRHNVTLVADPIERIESHAIITDEGTRYVADTLVLATGFDVVNFLSTMTVVGRDGVSLRDVWGEEDARAYMGLAVPGFPNFFMLYGPNTQTGHGGSLISLVEAQMHYIVGLLNKARDAGICALEIRREVHDDYNRRIELMHEDLVWTHPGMSTYYRNSKGRVLGATPFRVIDFWRQCQSPDLELFTNDSNEWDSSDSLAVDESAP